MTGLDIEKAGPKRARLMTGLAAPARHMRKRPASLARMMAFKRVGAG